MTGQENIYYQVEEYIQGNLAPFDSDKIKYLVENDPVYKEIYEDISLHNQVIIGASLARLREKMQADLASIEQKRVRKNKRIKNAGLIVGILGLLGSILFFVYPDKSPGSPPIRDSVNIEKTEKLLRPDNDHRQSLDDSSYKPEKAEVHELKLVPATLQPAYPIREKTGTDTLTSLSRAIPEDVEETSTSSDDESTTNDSGEQAEIDGRFEVICDSIRAELIVYPSCENRNTGKVIVAGIKGGTMPYLVYVGDEDISHTYEADNLKAGWYNVKISDHNQCTSTRKMLVSSERCFDNYEFSFNPDFGETWVIPSKNGNSGYMKIISRNGKIVYESKFGHNATNEWKGIDKTGKIVEYGMYICLLEYEDGHVEKFQVTVIR